jgi:sulfonate transport system ATP-binding protein
MSGQPTAVTADLAIDLPRPRDRRDPELARLRVQLLEALHLSDEKRATHRGDV